MSRRGCSLPANASGFDRHRASITGRFGQVLRPCRAAAVRHLGRGGHHHLAHGAATLPALPERRAADRVAVPGGALEPPQRGGGARQRHLHSRGDGVARLHLPARTRVPLPQPPRVPLLSALCSLHRREPCVTGKLRGLLSRIGRGSAYSCYVVNVPCVDWESHVSRMFLSRNIDDVGLR
eukprot:COSAG01_NODE_434_length_17079_cov_11.829270_24_plen_180_part_00